MSRRVASDSIDFGSDSFLDVIANIVGILIILIVVAGVRVSHAPPPTLQAAISQETRVDSRETRDNGNNDQAAVLSTLDSQLSTLASELAALNSNIARGSAELAELADSEQRFTARRDAMTRDLNSAAERVAAAARAVQAQEAAANTEQAQLAAQLVELESAANIEAPVIEIRHELTPVSRTVDGPELHFRLAENRVARLPIDELKDLLKRQVDRDRNWLMKVSRHTGSVGPVQGFSLEYLVERQPLSAIDELRYGRGMVMVGVTRWRLKPAADLQAETAEAALRTGSAFDMAIKTAQPGTTVTLWVYPDSFALFRELQKRAHEAGYEVAARPLPFGVLIGGSPDGSKSSAQ
jgi:TolA-binding protein